MSNIETRPIRWFDRYGNQILGTESPGGSDEWCSAMYLIDRLLGDPEYTQVAYTTFVAPGRTTSVITRWQGLDMRVLGDGPPLIFETFITGMDLTGTDYVGPWRYSTLDEAREGHAAICAQVSLAPET
jgi:hypothetical protein